MQPLRCSLQGLSRSMPASEEACQLRATLSPTGCSGLDLVCSLLTLQALVDAARM